MQSNKPGSWLLPVLAFMLLFSLACRSAGNVGDAADPAPPDPAPPVTSETVAEANTTSETVAESPVEPFVDEAVLTTALANIDSAYGTVDGIWPGFEPVEHPAVLAWKNPHGRLVGAVTINHPSPGEIGDAEEVEVDGAAIGTVHWMSNIDPEAAELLEDVTTYRFSTVIGGVDSFLMIAGGENDFFDPVALDYSSTLLHELFHRYQYQEFNEPYINQGVEGYAYTAENIEHAALEDQALLFGLWAEDDASRNRAARYAAAIRLARLEADERVALDEFQEIKEGSARYIEHRIGGDDERYPFHLDDFDQEIRIDPTGGPVKEYYGFRRWYNSGAALIRLLELLEVDNAFTRIEDGESPAAVLADGVGVTDADVERLVAEARAEYDASGDLAWLAVEAADTAAGEGPIFDENNDWFVGEDVADDGEERFMTDEHLACLVDEGFDIEVLYIEDDDTEIPQAIYEVCFG